VQVDALARRAVVGLGAEGGGDVGGFGELGPVFGDDPPRPVRGRTRELEEPVRICGPVLHGLERSHRSPELDALLHVLDRARKTRLRAAELVGRERHDGLVLDARERCTRVAATEATCAHAA
jgi:hypothetical protein